MFEKPFKSSGIVVIDNTFKLAFIVFVLIVTNLTFVVNEVKSLNFGIDKSILVFGGIFIFIFITFIYNMIKWNITYVSYSNKKITVYKNIVIKDMLEFSIKNISGIVMEESFIDKIFKVCRLKIYTYGVSNYTCDLEIVYNKEKCIKLRDEIIFDLEEKLDHNLEIDKSDIKINFKNVALHSFFNLPLTQIFVIINAILIIFFSLNESSNIKDAFSNLLGKLISIVGILIPVLYNFFKSIIIFYGLRLDRNGDFIHIKYGFLSTKRYIIPISKIKGIVLKETIISRIFNHLSVNIICPGITDNKNELKIILPMVKAKNVNELISKILYDKTYNIGTDYIKQPKECIYSILFYTLVGNTVVLPVLIYYNILNAYIAIVLIFSALIIVLTYYFKRIQFYDTYFVISTGVFLKKKVIMKYKDVKYFKIRKDPILYKYGINIIDIYITSGYKNRRHSLGYVDYNNATNILSRIFV